MRVLVAADAMADVGPRDASEIIGRAFADAGAQVAVVPLADGGEWFPAAVADFDADAVVLQPETLGQALDALSCGAARLYVDLTAVKPHPWDELVQVDRRRLEELRVCAAAAEVVAVVRSGQQGLTLTGLTGIVAERGRTQGSDLAETLAQDALVSAWLERLGLDGTVPGAGAAEGIGAIVLAMGGTIASGIEVCVDGFNAATTVASADLVVTGSSLLDFHAVGGDVVKEVARLATDALRPVIAIVGRNYVSSRELRLGGIESAHSILDDADGPEPAEAQVAQVAARVARSWIW